MKKLITKYLTELFTEIITKTMNEVKSPQEVQTDKAILRIKGFLKVCKMRNGRPYKIQEIEMNAHGQPTALKGEAEIETGITTPFYWAVDGRSATMQDANFDLIQSVLLTE